MSNVDTSSSPELDAAILARDQVRERYIVRKLQVQRRMAIIAFVQLVFGGAAVIIAGIFFPDLAARVEHMGSFLSMYFLTLGGFVAAYLGISAMNGNSSFSSYGGMGGYGGYGGMGGQQSYQSVLTHPPIVKTPHAVNVPPIVNQS